MKSVQKVHRDWESFDAYVGRLEAVAEQALRGTNPPDSQQVAGALDGEVARTFRRLVTATERKKAGAFFSGEVLGSRASAGWHSGPLRAGRTHDPAMGTGDLLLPVAAKIGVRTTLTETVELWGDLLSGRDIHEVLLRAARARLVLAAVVGGAKLVRQPRASLDHLFPLFGCGDGLSEASAFAKSTHVVLNPPFISVRMPKSCEWGYGRRSLAAEFLKQSVRNAREGTRVAAILPDALRVGPQYARWRATIAAMASDLRVMPIGAFADADVHVFLLRFRVRRTPADLRSLHEPCEEWHATSTGLAMLGAQCAVSVGPYVPHRHRSGQWRPMLDVVHAPAFGTVEPQAPHRRYHGRAESPPFVVVRRTSSPHDQHRAVPTLVPAGPAMVVENHLLIVRPRQNTLAACQKAMAVLRDPRTSAWLNRRIACRHLTVGALRELPWWHDAR